MHVFHRVEGAPTNTCIQLTSLEAARAWPTGTIELGYCQACEFIANLAFDNRLTEYSGRYEETQGHSATFNGFHRKLAQDLIDRYDVRGKRVIEIGCGKGEFLELMCTLGGNQGLGFDPGFDPDRFVRADNVEFVRDFYSEAYAGRHGDLVCCKMTLEHIPETRRFIDVVRRSTLDPATIVYFQVPNAERIFGDCAYEDVYYEHCSYFTNDSLASLFERAGFRVLDVRTEYDDQYLAIEAIPCSDPNPARSHRAGAGCLRRAIEEFPERYAAKRTVWDERVGASLARGERVAVWGAGSKAATFLHALECGRDVQLVVDINPYRQDHYMVGTGQRIVGPEHLRTTQPDLVIVMNSIYLPEVKAKLAGLGVHPQIHGL
jgi:SAM-dependent methyltransferase